MLFVLLEVAYKQYPPKLYSSVMVFVIHVVFFVMFDRMIGNITPNEFKTQDKKKTS
jgi:hypothetical protein